MRIETTETMRRVRYSTDVGGVYIGNDGFSFVAPNGYGDGWHEYVIYEDAEEFHRLCEREDRDKSSCTALLADLHVLHQCRGGMGERGREAADARTFGESGTTTGKIAIACWEKF